MIVRQIGLLAAFSAFISLGLSQPAQAQGAKIMQGQTLAQSLCSNCHIVGPGKIPEVVNADIPSFMAVAAKDGQSTAQNHSKRIESASGHAASPAHQTGA